MLKMTQLNKVYRTEMVETYALRHFDLEVRAGEFVAVTGLRVRARPPSSPSPACSRPSAAGSY